MEFITGSTSVNSVAISSDNKFIIAGSDRTSDRKDIFSKKGDSIIYIFDRESELKLHELLNHKDSVQSVSIS